MEREEFLAEALEAAKRASSTSGFPAGIAVAQAALESAWGKSGLSRMANNYFGIKAHGKHPWVELPTAEVVNNETVRVAARFAKYDSMEQCFMDRDRLILTSAAYAEARLQARHPEEFARALGKRWATDPQYAEKLLAIYRQHGLQKLDAANS